MKVDRRALTVFILLGLVSLTADMVYEGARSVSGSFLEELGGPAVGSAIIHSGDLIGYLMRFVGGAVATALGSSTAYWLLVFTGYLLNAASLPLLGVIGVTGWQVATALYLAERVGKGLRAPARDVIIAEVTEGIGRGKGFGLHELMDQTGAVAGPLIVGLILGFYGSTLQGYRIAFLALIVPAILSIVLVLTAWRLYPYIRSVEVKKGSSRITFRGFGANFWLYTASMAFLSLGFVGWAVLSYYLKAWGVLNDEEIAFAYTLAMAVDGAVAVPIGYLYDKVKLRSLYIAPLATAVIPFLVLAGGKPCAYTAAALWGIVMGIYETNMRAGIADLVKPELRAMAYGTFGLVYGITWTVGGFVLAVLFGYSSIAAAAFIVAVEVCSVITLSMIKPGEE